MTDAVEPTAGTAAAESPAGATVAAPAPLDIPVLELRHVNAAYGPFRALFDVSLTVGEGETVALLGRNGAGKTTVARVASGLVEPTEGEVMVDGNDFTKARAHRYAKAGVVHVPEGRAVFSDFTVEENLTLAFTRTHDRTGVRDALARAFDLFPPIAQRRSQIAGTLSGGEQRMLAMARVLVETPRLLIADELSLGPGPHRHRRGLRRAHPHPRRRHLAAHSGAAHGPRPGPMRPGHPPRPRHHHLAGPHRQSRRSHRHRPV